MKNNEVKYLEGSVLAVERHQFYSTRCRNYE